MQLNKTENMAFGISKILKKKFGDRISPTQIYDVVDDNSHRAFKMKFIAYDYFVILFNYEIDIIGCLIEQGKENYIPLVKGKNCYSNLELE
ncbi:hypothetical protein [Vallitalea guaymasensis]|uniref:Uncharacterized protein n=1 Tax=Vallitalea guaymasensis TaxID=1185412 RepID=A0A8J8M9I5_9FIRM|nr:hypothetical protein [Vallitalea guaymasensis]QUH28814.1 hypothetical protein HYG85_07760 [Vallitalea guaymasensis]